jgi:hypothetical protein
MPTNLSRPGRPNLGTGAHSPGPGANPLVNHELIGTVRWLDVDLERIVLDVRETDGRAGMFRGRNVTVDLTGARVDGASLDELVPGTEIRVRARLRRELGPAVPDPLPAVSVAVLPT